MEYSFEKCKIIGTMVDHGFFPMEEAGTFCRVENLIAPGGGLPINTSGGDVAKGSFTVWVFCPRRSDRSAEPRPIRSPVPSCLWSPAGPAT
jgi:hypothetical protein